MTREEDIVSRAVEFVKAKEAARVAFALPLSDFRSKMLDLVALKGAELDAYDALKMAVEDAGYASSEDS